MSLIRRVERCIEFNRCLGCRYVQQERMLLQYAEFAMGFGDEWTRSDRIIEWASSVSSPNAAANRLRTAGKFALSLHAEDERHEVPPSAAAGRRMLNRPSPCLPTRGQVRRVMDAALRSPSRDPIAPHARHCLFGLLAATGMRRSEALALRLSDLTSDGLIVRESKFRKSRLLPLREDTWRALDDYVAVRKQLGAPGDHLFVLSSGKPPASDSATRAFLRFLRRLGLRGAPGEPGPRLHDLRHSYCARVLESFDIEQDPGTQMLALSTSAGHSSLAHTCWYLKATHPLLRRIAGQAEQAQTGRAKE